MHLFTQLFVFLLLLSLGLQLWLIGRQIRHVAANRTKVPEAFAGSISLEAHQKAADYTLSKARLGRYETIYAALILLGLTLGGGLQWLDEQWRAIAASELWIGVGFILSVMVVTSLLDLPFSIYRTFRIEQRFGFNRMTAALFVSDLLKQTLLLVVIGVPLATLVLWLMGSMGDNWWLYVWLVWSGFSLLMMWAYPAIIAPIFNKFSPLEDESMRARIDALLQRCGFTSNGIFVMDGSRRSAHGNAYFTGMGNNKRIVFFDTLLESLNGEEVEAVLAHELGHFRRKHVRKRLTLVMLMSLAGLAVLGWLSQQAWFFHGLGISQPSMHTALVLFLMVAPVFTFLIEPVMAFFMRRHEFEADDFAAQHASAADLIRALVKLYEENASTLTPDPLYSAFHDSHPPAPVRIGHLSTKIQPS